MRYIAPVEFIHGSWKDYLAGKYVEFQLSPEGMKVETKNLMNGLKNIYRKQIKSVFPGATIKSLSVGKVKTQGPTVLRGDRNLLVVSQAARTWEVSAIIDNLFES